MFNINTILNGVTEDTRWETKKVIEILRASSLKFMRQWNEDPSPLWLSVALEEHKARIATYDYILMVLDLDKSKGTPVYMDMELPDHYEGIQYLAYSSLDVVLAVVKALILSGHEVEISEANDDPHNISEAKVYKIKYKR